MGRNINIYKGFVELMVFIILDTQKEVYAFELLDLIGKYSNYMIDIDNPTIYITLYRLNDRGYLALEERIVGNRKRKYYSLTDAGRKYFKERVEDYMTINEGMNNMFSYYNGKRGDSVDE